MADGSTIEWLARPGTKPATWNPVRGCTRVSEGCRGCYAEGMAARFSKPGMWGHGFAEMKARGGERGTRDREAKGAQPRWTGKVALIEDQITLPLRWREPRTIFANSTSDLFHERLPDEAIDRIFAVMALCPQHTFIVLTKRPERMRGYCRDQINTGRWRRALRTVAPAQEPSLISDPLPNVWLGTSIEDQAAADERIPLLLDTPAAIRFVSAEPLLGLIDLLWALNGHACQECADWGSTEEGDCDHSADPGYAWKHAALTRAEYSARPTGAGLPELGSALIDWVIVGGESGAHARPMHPDWARSLRDQCVAAGVPFFFKQWGEWAPGDAFGLVSDGPITDRRGNVHNWMRRYVVRADRADRLDAHSFTGHATNLVYRVGKKAAGDRLDGQQWHQWPQPEQREAA